eukprot:CAMPEP_0168529864 /NCGR_PEP_ID=MMETSP0405-20121227/14216_1 /TAXON_ID=498012 /ORGANISM="Trichosphaerium sp, Strain Am-I-7 wt" /LENGTH=69 /DNA_ID=CAMNT_0008553777 /DNA_START=103 /DNA_END=309 /DNA_ORIENTATION=+
MNVVHEPENKRFVINFPEKNEMAKIEYHPLKKLNHYEFWHTETPESMRGQGIAGKVAKGAFDYALEHEW